MSAVLAALQVSDRVVWAADSFQEMPQVTSSSHPLDQQQWARSSGAIAVTRAEVTATFALFGLLNDRVRFVPGWFERSLPEVAVERIAVLRLDADLYASTPDGQGLLLADPFTGAQVLRVTAGIAAGKWCSQRNGCCTSGTSRA